MKLFIGVFKEHLSGNPLNAIKLAFGNG